MRMEYKHKLDKKEAYKRIDTLLEAMQDKYSEFIAEPNKKWNSSKDEMKFSVSIMDNYVEGTVYLKDKKVVLEAELPFMARMFSSKIESIIKEQLDKKLA